jgi:RNA polymerase sigma-70 factor (ECF subfamily)
MEHPPTDFAALLERHRRELHVHCYRLLGSLDDADDLVQETFLKAWRKRQTSRGPATVRAWLYRIATNACLDALARQPRRVMPWQLGPPMDPTTDGSAHGPPVDLPWLQPYPDHLLDADALVVARETIEIAFLAAMQLLPPRQRAVLVLCDVLDFSAHEAAKMLHSTTAAVNGALQRARATLRKHHRVPPTVTTASCSAEEREILERFVAAFERSDCDAIASLLSENARGVMPPVPAWHGCRAIIVAAVRAAIDPQSPTYIGHVRKVPIVGANRQPACALYLRTPTDPVHRAHGIVLLRIEESKIVEITAFLDPALFPAFGLPLTQ